MGCGRELLNVFHIVNMWRPLREDCSGGPWAAPEATMPAIERLSALGRSYPNCPSTVPLRPRGATNCWARWSTSKP